MTLEQLNALADAPVVRDKAVAARALKEMCFVPISELGNLKLNYNNGRSQHDTILEKVGSLISFRQDSNLSDIVLALEAFRKKQSYDYGTALSFLARLHEGYTVTAAQTSERK